MLCSFCFKLTRKQALSIILKALSLQLYKVLIYDAGLAALLMMGNLSVGLKKHAVSMFDVGRLEHDQIDSLISELRWVFKLIEPSVIKYKSWQQYPKAFFLELEK